MEHRQSKKLIYDLVYQAQEAGIAASKVELVLVL
jgi:hypothetical protein